MNYLVGKILQTDRQTDRQTEYDLLRIILVVCVVLSHGTYYNISTHFGGIHYYSLMVDSAINQPEFYKLVSVIKEFIYTFHMPAFIALSGSLYAMAKTVTFRKLAVKKAKRLLIPFFTVWLLWNLPIKYFAEYYLNISLQKMLLQLALPSCVYLWYLESLFLIFLIMRFIQSVNIKIQSLIVLCLWCIGVCLFKELDEYHVLGDPFYYLGWFYIGYEIENIIKFFQKYRLWNCKLISAIAFADFVIFLLVRYLKDEIIYFWFSSTILPLFMIIILNYLVRAINPHGKFLEKASGYCFGIYLYAEPLNYLILYLFYEYCGIEYFGTNIGAAVIYFSRIFITPIIAICITWALKKMKLKYLY